MGTCGQLCAAMCNLPCVGSYALPLHRYVHGPIMGWWAHVPLHSFTPVCNLTLRGLVPYLLCAVYVPDPFLCWFSLGPATLPCVLLCKSCVKNLSEKILRKILEKFRKISAPNKKFGPLREKFPWVLSHSLWEMHCDQEDCAV